MISRRLVTIVGLVAGLALAPLAAQSTIRVFHVSSSSGDDLFAGTESQPWQTLARAVAEGLLPGDVIRLKAGDVWSEPLVPLASGTPASPIRWTRYGAGPAPRIEQPSAPSAPPVMEPDQRSDLIFEGLHVVGGKDAVRVRSCQRIVLRACQIEGAYRYGCVVTGATTLDVTIEDCEIHHVGGDAINLHRASGLQIRRNRIHRLGDVGAVDGIAFHECDAAMNVVEDNVIEGPFEKAGVSAFESLCRVTGNFITGARKNGIVSDGAHGDVLAYNNVIVVPENAWTAGSGIKSQDGGLMAAYNNTVLNMSEGRAPSLSCVSTASAYFANNISVCVGESAAHFLYDFSGLLNEAHNLFWPDDVSIVTGEGRFGGGEFIWVDHETWAANIPNAGSFVADPLLDGPLPWRLSTHGQLAPGSPAVDAGYDLSAVFTSDAFGTARPSGGWDIGAVELTSVVSPPQVTVVQDPDTGYLTLSNGNLEPGSEVYNVFSLTPAPFGAGTGSISGLHFDDPGAVLLQLAAPLDDGPLHFLASAPGVSFESLAPPMIDVTFEILCVAITPSNELLLSEVSRLSVR